MLNPYDELKNCANLYITFTHNIQNYGATLKVRSYSSLEKDDNSGF